MRKIVQEALGGDQGMVELHSSIIFAKLSSTAESGAWSPWEVGLAILGSGRTLKQIELPSQIEGPDDYDIEYKVTPAKGAVVSVRLGR